MIPPPSSHHVVLRCAEPYPPDQWTGPDKFNDEYLGVLVGWDIRVDGLNPVTPMNLAPVVAAPSEQTFHWFGR